MVTVAHHTYDRDLAATLIISCAHRCATFRPHLQSSTLRRPPLRPARCDWPTPSSNCNSERSLQSYLCRSLTGSINLILADGTVSYAIRCNSIAAGQMLIDVSALMEPIS